MDVPVDLAAADGQIDTTECTVILLAEAWTCAGTGTRARRRVFLRGTTGRTVRGALVSAADFFAPRRAANSAVAVGGCAPGIPIRRAVAPVDFATVVMIDATEPVIGREERKTTMSSMDTTTPPAAY